MSHLLLYSQYYCQQNDHPILGPCDRRAPVDNFHFRYPKFEDYDRQTLTTGAMKLDGNRYEKLLPKMSKTFLKQLKVLFFSYHEFDKNIFVLYYYTILAK